MDVGKFNGHRFYTALRLDYRLRVQAPTSSSRAVSVVADLLVSMESLYVICCRHAASYGYSAAAWSASIHSVYVHSTH